MTQIKFGTDGWRAIIAKEYTVENVARVSLATANWLNDKFENVIKFDKVKGFSKICSSQHYEQ